MCLELKYLLIQEFSQSGHEMNPNENVNPSIIDITSCKAIGDSECRKSKKSLRKISVVSSLKLWWIPRISNSILNRQGINSTKAGVKSSPRNSGQFTPGAEKNPDVLCICIPLAHSQNFLPPYLLICWMIPENPTHLGLISFINQRWQFFSNLYYFPAWQAGEKRWQTYLLTCCALQGRPTLYWSSHPKSCSRGNNIPEPPHHHCSVLSLHEWYPPTPENVNIPISFLWFGEESLLLGIKEEESRNLHISLT